MKNLTTPRTMADCQFVTGYSESYINDAARREARWHRVMYALVVVAIGLAFYFGA